MRIERFDLMGLARRRFSAGAVFIRDLDFSKDGTRWGFNVLVGIHAVPAVYARIKRFLSEVARTCKTRDACRE